MNPSSLPAPHRWTRRLTGPLAAAAVLAGFWVFMLSSLRDKSVTTDEIVHATAGYTYWKFSDYRLNPENGILPQRVMGLPLVLGDYRPPPTDDELWRASDEWGVADVWFHQMGNDLPGMLRRGRGAMGVLTVFLGALVWYWARRLFGPLGGMLSLLLFVTSPIMLANGALMTSDATCSLFFLAAIMSLWTVLHRLSAGRLLLSGLVVGGLFVAKMSAVLMLPIGLTLVIARLIGGRPLRIGFGLNRDLTNRTQQAWASAAVVLAHVIIVPLVIWGFYGFRYSAFAPPVSAQDQFQHPWELVLEKASTTSSVWTAPAPALSARVFDFIRKQRLLPEAYVYGYAHAWRFSRMRSAFFNGEYGISGWKTFFPYTFLVKTPLAFFGIMALAIAAGFWKWREAAQRTDTPIAPHLRNAIYETLPLWTLLGFYWAAVIPSRLNIGHRHIMATYAPLFVLCGSAAYLVEAWWSDRARLPVSIATPTKMARVRLVLLGSLLVWLFADVGYRYPHYLAYFNGIVTPSKAHRHLVDSSLDWGQDLPGLRRYIDAHASAGPRYLSYFGTASPAYYGISATLLFSPTGLDQPRTPVRELQTPLAELETQMAVAMRAWPDCEVVARRSLANGDVSILFLRKPALPRLAAGTYFISATMLPAISFRPDGPLGPWNERFEATYQQLDRSIQPLLADDAQQRAAAFAKLSVPRWTEIFESFAQYRFARLTAYLRQREPDDTIGFSILVYQLTATEIERALHGPPAELGVDFPHLLTQRGEL